MINYNICSFKSQDNKFDQKNLEHRVDVLLGIVKVPMINYNIFLII